MKNPFPSGEELSFWIVAAVTVSKVKTVTKHVIINNIRTSMFNPWPFLNSWKFHNGLH